MVSYPRRAGPPLAILWAHIIVAYRNNGGRSGSFYGPGPTLPYIRKGPQTDYWKGERGKG